MLPLNYQRSLYPEPEPYNTGYIKVSDIHTLYFEEVGSPYGRPSVFFHGGPGAAISSTMRRLHDPSKYRLILFDQRGCGKSTPYATLEQNTTWDLVDDAEKLRIHLGIERWQVCGGSWGSSLALAYAEKHPERVTQMILRGIFALRKKEIDWFYQSGASYMFPEAFSAYKDIIPVDEHHDMVSAYYRRLTDHDPCVRKKYAKAWSTWEASALSLVPDEDRVREWSDDDYAVAIARIECHYFMNNGFLKKDDQLIQEVSKLKDVEAVIIQGRYDVVTPFFTAWDLYLAWEQVASSQNLVNLSVVLDAGHAASEPGIVNAFVRATNRFAGTTH